MQPKFPLPIHVSTIPQPRSKMAQDPNQHFHTLPLDFPYPDNVFIDLFGDEDFDENDPFMVAWRNAPVPRPQRPQRPIDNIGGMIYIDASGPMGADCPICALRAASLARGVGHANGGFGVAPEGAQGEDAGFPDTASQGGYGAYGDGSQHDAP